MRVQSVQFVTSFEVDKQIIFSAGQALQDINKRLGGRLMNLNVPSGAPDDMPRAVVQSSNTFVGVALNRFDVGLSNPDTNETKDFDSFLKETYSRAELILKPLLKTYPKYSFVGAVVVLNFPMATDGSDGISMIAPLFEKIVAIKRGERKLSSFQLVYGFSDEIFNRNITIQSYETRTLELSVDALNPKPINLDVKTLPIKESGVQVMIDINNLNDKNKKYPLEDLQKIVSDQVETYKKVLKETGLDSTKNVGGLA